MNELQFIAPTPRKKMTKKRRVKIFLARNGICCVCGKQIRGSSWIIEHPDPLDLGGSDDDSELHPAHVKCGKKKTGKDRKDIAARDSAIDRGYAGPEKKSSFRGWRKFNGDIVYND